MTDYLDHLVVIADHLDDAKVALEGWEQGRAKAIRGARKAGVSAVDIAFAARLSRPRVYQILSDRSTTRS